MRVTCFLTPSTLKLLEPDAAKAKAHFERALAVARRQQAKSWELRAALDLSRLWRYQGKVQQAREVRHARSERSEGALLFVFPERAVTKKFTKKHPARFRAARMARQKSNTQRNSPRFSLHWLHGLHRAGG
jgi:hypothetical protein